MRNIGITSLNPYSRYELLCVCLFNLLFSEWMRTKVLDMRYSKNPQRVRSCKMLNHRKNPPNSLRFNTQEVMI